MATSSIFANVVIEDEHSAEELINALETARNTPSKKVIVRYPVEDVKGEELKEFLKDVK